MTAKSHEQAIGANTPFRAVAHDGFSALVDPGPALGVSLCLAESFSTDCRVDGQRSVQTPHIGDFAMLAPGYPTQVTIIGKCRALQFWIPLTTLASIVEEEQEVDGGALDFAPNFDRRDLALFAKVARAFASKEEKSADLYTRDVVLHLCRYHSSLADRPGMLQTRRGGLTPIRLRRVTDFVEAHLERAISIEEMASEAALSPFHFAREFKRTIGSAPHSYVIERRLSRALTMLGRRGANAEEVARRTGFSHASHLSRHLRARFGASADRFRTLAQA